MMYLTESEAKRILDYSSLDCCILNDNNPNISACRALSKVIRDNDSGYFNAALGFVLGVVAGKRMERERRKARNLKTC